MIRVGVIALLISGVSSFHMSANRARGMGTRQTMMVSSDSPPEVETPAAAPSTVSEFAAPGVAAESSSVTEEGEVEIDFDALSAESAGEAFQPKTDISDLIDRAQKAPRKAPRQAKWLPLLLSPEALDGELAGDVGFDPVGFSKDKESLYRMREAEIKHSRLAMLAAAGWPMSELWHREIADAFGLQSILASENKAPSVLNGGLDNAWIIGAAVVSLAIGGLLEFKTFDAQKKDGYRPGELGFDPLKLHTFRASFNLDQIGEKASREVSNLSVQ